MFLINTYIIYGAAGICQVKDIGNIKIEGMESEKLYYTLEPLHSKGGTIYTPADNNKVVMRKIISKEDAWKLVQDVPNIEAICVIDDKRCEQVYKELLKKYECRDLVKLYKCLYLKKDQRNTKNKKLPTLDNKYLNFTEDRLFEELALSLEMSRDKVEEIIIEKIKAPAKG